MRAKREERRSRDKCGGGPRLHLGAISQEGRYKQQGGVDVCVCCGLRSRLKVFAG
jgi:hypothetical protein